MSEENQTDKEKVDKEAQDKARQELILEAVYRLTDAIKELTWMIRQKF